MLDFRVNMNSLGAPPMPSLTLRALRALIAEYPGAHSSDGAERVARLLGVRSSCVALGVGATEFIFLIPRLFPKPTGVVLQPTFWEYKEALSRAGPSIIEVDLEASLWLDKRDVPLPPIRARGDYIVFICNPNNPTGRLHHSNEIVELARRVPDSLVVVDETYLLFREDYSERSVAHLASEMDNLLVITSLSKFFAIPGLRIGAVVGAERLVAQVRKHQIPYGIGKLGEWFLSQALPCADYVEQSRVQVEKQRSWMMKHLMLMDGLRVVKTDANFFLFSVSDTVAANPADWLAARGIQIRSGVEFRGLGASWGRAALLDRRRNGRLLSALQAMPGIGAHF